MITKKGCFKVITTVLTSVVLVGNILQVYAVSTVKAAESSNVIRNEGESIISESFYDQNGQLIQINGTENGNNVRVYVNGRCTQIVHKDLLKNEISIEYFNSGKEINSINNLETYTLNKIETYNLSDFIQTMDVSTIDGKISLSEYDMDGWALYGEFTPSPILGGSKTCELYFRNYDEEPDMNRYEGQRVSFSEGTAVGIVVSALSSFITGGVSIVSIISGLGSAIIGDVIVQSVTGDVCFSTQKIKYAPIIDGNYVWYDAYITKRWVIIADLVNGTNSFELDNASYDSNRGQTPEDIAFNAQVATMD